jgi:hypothetical protein
MVKKITVSGRAPIFGLGPPFEFLEGKRKLRKGLSGLSPKVIGSD